MSRIIVIADDLTGANDTGVQFAKRGFHTISLLDVTDTEYVINADVWVINAETRSLDASRAYQTTTEIAAKLPQGARMFKKIDSTMRGNIGTELNALLDCGEYDVAVVIPAYPGNKRTTVGGYHFLNKVLLEDTEISRDPKCPVTESHLPTLLAIQTGRDVGYIGLRMIRKDLQKLLNEVNRQKSDGKQIIVFDSESQEDLQTITRTLLDSNLRVLWVGSAGLGQALAEELAGYGYEHRIEPYQGNSDQPTFVIAGSVSEITSQQVKAFQEQSDYRIVTANPLVLLDQEKRDNSLTELTSEIISIIDEGRCPVLVTDTSQSSRQAVEDWINKSGMTQVDSGNSIADCLGQVAAAVLKKRKVRGFVLTGGDIAYRTCLHLQVKALRIVGEVEEGIPLSTVLGGSADKLPVVTKAGAFGNKDSLVRAVEKIQEYAQGEKE